jgi:WD40 repeat protein
LLALLPALAAVAAGGCGHRRAKPLTQPEAVLIRDGEEDVSAEVPSRERRRPPFPASVSAAAFSADNKYVLVGYKGDTNRLVLWELDEGKQVRSLSWKGGAVTGVAFVAGGRQALSTSRDGRLYLHDVATGKLLRGMRADKDSVWELAVTPDGTRALTCGSGKDGEDVLKLWDVQRLWLLRTFGGSRSFGRGVALSPDHRWALQAQPPRLWDLSTGRVARSLGHKGPWDEPEERGPTMRGRTVRALDPEETWNGGVAAFAPDSRSALLARRQPAGKDFFITRLAVWDFSTGKAPRLLDGEGGLVAQFTPSGAEVVGLASYTGAAPYVEHGLHNPLTVNRWDVASGKVVRSVSLPLPEEWGKALAFSPDGRLALLAAGQVLRKRGSEHPGGLRPNRGTLRVAIWDLDTGRPVREWTHSRPDW